VAVRKKLALILGSIKKDKNTDTCIRVWGKKRCRRIGA